MVSDGDGGGGGGFAYGGEVDGFAVGLLWKRFCENSQVGASLKDRGRMQIFGGYVYTVRYRNGRRQIFFVGSLLIVALPAR